MFVIKIFTGFAMPHNKQNPLLDSDNIMYSIVRISLPMMATGLSDALYNMVDSIFVGNFVDERALAALTVNNIIQNFLLALSTLYGAGIVSIVSRALGAKNYSKVNDTIVNGGFLCFATTAFFSYMLLLNLDPVLFYLGSSLETLVYSRQYASVILFFGFLVPTNGVLMGVLRARGEVRSIMMLAVLGASANITLDFIFIVILRWGVSGAAWATICSQSVVTFFLLRRIHYFYNISFNFSYLRRMSFKMVAEIYSIGISNFSRVFTFVLMGISANAALAPHGTAALAAYGIVQRIMQMAYQPIFASNLGTQSLIGYNYGAGRYAKVGDIIRKAVMFATLLGIPPAIVLLSQPHAIFNMFTDSELTLQYADSMSRVVGSTFFLYGLQVFSTGALLAMGRARIAFFVSILRPAVMVLCMNILPRVMGLSGVWTTFPVTDLIGSTITALVMVRELRNLKTKSLEALETENF